MISEVTKHALSMSVVPVILGDGFSARVLSMKVFLKYGLQCVICDERQSAWRYLIGFGGFYRMIRCGGELLEQELDSIEALSDGALIIIVPCGAEFESLVNTARENIEKRFILASRDNLLRKIYPKD